MDIGAVITWRLEGDFGGGVIIGEPHYAQDYEVVVVATPDTVGMPIHTSHCKRIGVSDMKLALELRERYVALYPEFLKGAR
jgi:hypothetical protein